jgi:hypothetical protein
MKNITYILSILIIGCNNFNGQNKSYSDNSSLTELQDTTTQAKPTTRENEISVAKKFEFKNSDRPREDTLILKTDHKYYVITPLGLFITTSNDTIHLKTELIVEKAYMYEDKTDFFVFFTDTDYEGSTSWIQNISKNPLKSAYVKQIPGFNLGQPVIDGQFALVTAIGFIGKVNLKTGEYVWKHKDLYDREKYSFNSFDTLIVKQSETEFISENYNTNKIDKVIVDNLTGEIKRIEK